MFIMLSNKKGQGLSVNAIIMIVLGVAVLVLLIAGFSMGWGTIFPFLKTNNVDIIAKACTNACTTESIYDYCSMERELKDGEGNKIKTSCAVLSIVPEFKKYGVEKCGVCECEGLSIEGNLGMKMGSLTIKSCTEFNGKESECKTLDILNGDWCKWTPGAGTNPGTCTGTYKTPTADFDNRYDVTDATNLNKQTTACVIDKS